jgi:hypothetical protein
MKVSAKDLRAAFDVCDAVEAESLDSSLFVRINQNAKELSLTLTGDLWAEGRATGSEGNGKWTAYVDRNLLKAFLATAIPSGEVTLLLKDDKLTLKSGNKLELALHDAINGYESWKPTNKYDVSAELQRIIDTSTNYLSVVAGTENVDAINVQTDCVVVTNTTYLLGFLGRSFPTNVLLPPKIAAFLAKNGGKLAADKNGVGVATDHGCVYLPISSKLAKYPLDGCKKRLAESAKQPTSIIVSAQGLLTVVEYASQFLKVNKSDTGVVISQDKGLLLTIPLDTGVFQRTIPATIKTALPEVQWAVKKSIPWLKLAVATDSEMKVEIARIKGALVFRFNHQKKQYLFLSADMVNEE